MPALFGQKLATHCKQNALKANRNFAATSSWRNWEERRTYNIVQKTAPTLDQKRTYTTSSSGAETVKPQSASKCPFGFGGNKSSTDRLRAKLSTIQTTPTTRDQQRRTATSSATPEAVIEPQSTSKCPFGFGGSKKQAPATRTEPEFTELKPRESKCPFGFGGSGKSADAKTGYWKWSFSQLLEGAAADESTKRGPEKDAAKQQAAAAFAEAAPFAEIPGPPQNRITGSLPHLVYHDGCNKINRYLRTLHDDYGHHTKLVRISWSQNNELVCYDPNLFLKIYLAGSSSTSSLGEGLWPLRNYFVSRDRKWNVRLAGGGKDWQRARGQVNPHLFDPRIVATYLPAINKAAAQASVRIGEVCCSKKNAENNVDAEGQSEPMLLHEFMTYAAFDMFSAFALDKQLRTVNRGLPATASAGIYDEMHMPPAKEDFAFVEDTRSAMHIMGPLVRTPKYLSYFQFKKFAAYLDKALDRGYALVDEVLERPRTIGEQQGVRSSFVGRLAAAGEMTDAEIKEAMSAFLVAAVDTTSNTLNWVLVHLANNPDIQARLYEEVSSVLKDTENNDFCKKKLAQMPFLKACVRESFRLSPGIQWIERRTQRDMVLNGFQIPAGTRIMLNWDVCYQNEGLFTEGSSNGDGEEHPASEFRPERFMPAAVEERKGTFKSVLDNKIVSKPFSFGPRMCPGSRVAETEMYSLICRIVQDWEFSLKDVAPKTPHGNPGPAWEAHEVLMTRADPFPKFVFERRSGAVEPTMMSTAGGSNNGNGKA